MKTTQSKPVPLMTPPPEQPNTNVFRNEGHNAWATQNSVQRVSDWTTTMPLEGKIEVDRSEEFTPVQRGDPPHKGEVNGKAC